MAVERHKHTYSEVITLPDPLQQFVLHVKEEMRSRRSYIKGNQPVIVAHSESITKEYRQEIIRSLRSQEKNCWVDFGYGKEGGTLIRVIKDGRKQFRKR